MEMDRRCRRMLGLALFALGASVPVHAQAPVDTTQYTVAYVDVMPSSMAMMTAALTRYRDASRREEGYVGVDLLEQVGRPGRYAVVETWSDQRGLDAHTAAAHRETFRDDPWRFARLATTSGHTSRSPSRPPLEPGTARSCT